ncbi:hypothetical protein Q8A73_002481 [Channa argus]|nr:hypothetical protein Q8A73_002481 [Channa argus]
MEDVPVNYDSRVVSRGRDTAASYVISEPSLKLSCCSQTSSFSTLIFLGKNCAFALGMLGEPQMQHWAFLPSPCDGGMWLRTDLCQIPQRIWHWRYLSGPIPASLGLHYLCVYCENVRTSLCGERASQIDGQRSSRDLADFHSYHIDRFIRQWHGALYSSSNAQSPWIHVVNGKRIILELTASQWRKGFEPEGYSLYQRLIATSEQGTAPKQTFSAVKTGSGLNDVGQQGFFTARPLWRRLPEMDKQQDMSCQRQRQRQQQQQETDLAAL